MTKVILLGFLLVQLICLIYSASDKCGTRCDARFDRSFNCQCNKPCERHHDCCSDYWSICRGGGAVSTHSPNITTGGSVHGTYTGSESSIAQTLWDADVDRLGAADLKLNYGGHTGRGPGSDHAPMPFFSFVNEAKLSRPTFKALQDLWDNYHTSESQHEISTPQHEQEISIFLDSVINTRVMQIAYNFLTTFKYFTGDQNAFKTKLHQLWFDLYSRKHGGITNSCGFEHIFLGEFKGSSVSGFHNWLRFYHLEKSGRADYKGYINKKGPFLVEFTFTWDGKWKPISSFFIGTSPEFDMALSTICILSGPNRACKYTLEGEHFRIQNYDNSHVHGLQIASAYPEV